MPPRRGQGRGSGAGGGRDSEEREGFFHGEGGGRWQQQLQPETPPDVQRGGGGGGGRGRWQHAERISQGGWREVEQRASSSSSQDWRAVAGLLQGGGSRGRGQVPVHGYGERGRGDQVGGGGGGGGRGRGYGGRRGGDQRSARAAAAGRSHDPGKWRGSFQSEAGGSSSSRHGGSSSYVEREGGTHRDLQFIQGGSWSSPAVPPYGELLPGFSTERGQESPLVLSSLRVSEESMPKEAPGEEDARAILASEARARASFPLISEKLLAPSRPSPGIAGQRIKVRANHLKVTFRPGDNIYQYDVEITPKISSKVMARVLERQLVDAYRSEFNGKLPVYDGSKSMYTHGPLPFEQRDFSIILLEDRGTSIREKKFTFTIRHVSTLNRKNLQDFIAGKQVPTPQEHLQALDVLLREHPALHFISVSRSFFKSDLGKAPLEGGLVALNGFYQSLRPTKEGLQLNVDMSTTAFHASIPVVDFLKEQFRNFNPAARLSDGMRVNVRRALARLKVQVIHRQTPRKYRISGVSTSPTKDLKFPLEGGEEMSVVEYFKRTYNYAIEFPELPCLQVQANKTSYLPMEVCVICDGQKYGGKLNDKQTQNLRGLACVLPRVREEKIVKIMCREDGPGRGEHVSNFGVEVAKELTVVQARLLPAPKLRYGEQGEVTEIVPHLGAWNLLNSCVVEGGTVAHWALISFDRGINFPIASEFICSLSRRCNELGVRMAQETVVEPLLRRLDDLESSRLEKNLRYVCDLASQAIRNSNQGRGGHLQLLVCVMAEKHPAYGELKRICETQIGVVTQCCLSRHVKQRKSQYLANLALKVNAKVGGRNVTLALELPLMCPVFNRPTIIFGADVTHPPPGDDGGPSIAAVVANIDWPSANKYIARVRAQAHREEIIENLKEMVQELWHEYYEKVRCRPDRVIMFRDGVSEGQFDEVLQKEVVALKEAFIEVGGPDYSPLVTWAVVQKRHHTRLFPADGFKDKNNNILPGTVVDTTITHPREFDFYLCSHAGIQGTSRPTHYHVLWDENNFKSDDLQGLVYNLCYTYARCTRAVSVVPPAYYAHLAAYRARLYLDSFGGSDTTSLRGGGRSSTSLSGGGASSRAAAPTVRALPRVQRNVQEVMYFC